MFQFSSTNHINIEEGKFMKGKSDMNKKFKLIDNHLKIKCIHRIRI